MEPDEYENRIGKQPIKFASIMTDAKMTFINNVNQSITRILRENNNITDTVMDLLQQVVGTIMSEFDTFFDKLTVQMITVFQNSSNEMLEEIKKLQNKVNFYESALAQNKTENVIYLKEVIKEKNEIMEKFLKEIDYFKVLAIIEKAQKITMPTLRKKSKYTPQKLGKLLKWLQDKGYVIVNKNKKPYTIIFKKAPWSDIQ